MRTSDLAVHPDPFVFYSDMSQALDVVEGSCQAPFGIEKDHSDFLPANERSDQRDRQEEQTDRWLSSAMTLVNAGEYALARQMIMGLSLEIGSGHQGLWVESLRWIGWCCENEGKLDESILCWQEVCRHDAKTSDLMKLASLYELQKHYPLAGQLLRQAMSTCEEEHLLFEIHKNLGNVSTCLGDYEEAEENYFKALGICHDADGLLVNLGSMNFQRKKLEEAQHYFAQALQMRERNEKAWCGLALVVKELGEYARARALLLRALDINPTCLVALQVLIAWAFENDDKTEAIERTLQYVNLRGDDGDMIYSLAGLYYSVGQFKLCEAWLDCLASIAPHRTDGPELRALLRTTSAKTPSMKGSKENGS